MLSNLLEVRQRLLLSLHDRRHPPQTSLFELLATIQGVAELQKANIVLRDLGHQVSGLVELTQSDFVVILVVQDIHQ